MPRQLSSLLASDADNNIQSGRGSLLPAFLLMQKNVLPEASGRPLYVSWARIDHLPMPVYFYYYFLDRLYFLEQF